jgi:hypothetical protein
LLVLCLPWTIALVCRELETLHKEHRCCLDLEKTITAFPISVVTELSIQTVFQPTTVTTTFSR